ncbi:MAG: fructose-6-phosphate aldolase [Chloroflexi bacterium]|nr:fructose-6-phosphate aldolase [Chloroflexota bacterium]
MELFLDTASLGEIRQALRMGVVAGVTTNPSLAAKEGIGEVGDYRQAVQEIARMVEGPVSAEVLSTDYEGMVLEAREIDSWAPNVVAKIPSTLAGFEAIAALSREGIKINQTLCFSVNQALLGARAGATFVSPFVGRLDDEGHDGMQVVADIVRLFAHYGLGTKVLAASIRHPLHCVAAAKAGAHIATVPFKVLTQMAHHPLTDVGIARFLADWKRTVKV